MNTIVEQLRAQIRSVETENRNDEGEVIGHGCAELDQLLPGVGYPRGSLVQWITSGGQGGNYLALQVAKQACLAGGALVVIDPLSEFYPPAAASMGIRLENLIVLQPTDRNDLLWAIDQSLRCPAVAAVWNVYGGLPIIDEIWFRRFQLSAEASGCIGLFVQPLVAARRPSWAEVQWLVHSRRQGTVDGLSSPVQHCQLELRRCRGGQVGQTIQIKLDPVQGSLLADSASPQFQLQHAHQPPCPLPASTTNRLPMAS